MFEKHRIRYVGEIPLLTIILRDNGGMSTIQYTDLLTSSGACDSLSW